MSVRKRILIIARAFNMILWLSFSVIFDSGWRLCFPLVSSVSKSKGGALKKYRVEIFMIKPYDFVDRWSKRPDENGALEAFGHELLTLDADKHFKIEVSEV
jgi:hypothetical protein